MGNVLSAYHVSECEVQMPCGSGSIRGVEFDFKVRRFANIPYAMPPIGQRRWRKPQPLPKHFSYTTSHGEAFDGTKFGQVCPQPDYSDAVKKKHSQHTYGEDCLRLNIWAPSVDASSESSPRWPVIVWFHGGWFQMGEPNQEQSTDPTELVKKINVVFVAVGYRLNVFGFLAGDALLEESSAHGVGNYGLWDQRLVMEWVHENITAFGGDPENITLSGRSAGAYSVQAQVFYDFRGSIADISRNRFHRLVMISNAIPTQPKKIHDCQAQFDELCMHFSISLDAPGHVKLHLLRKIPGGNLTAAIMKLKHHTFRPVTDGDFILDGIFDYFRSGSFAKEFKRRGLRLFIGEVLDENTLYGATNGPDANQESLRLQLLNYYSPAATSRLLQYYSFPKPNVRHDWETLFGRIVADGQVRAPIRFLVNNLTQHGIEIHNVWRYTIAYRLSFITEKVAPRSFGVSHLMDKPFWKLVFMNSRFLDASNHARSVIRSSTDPLYWSDGLWMIGSEILKRSFGMKRAMSTVQKASWRRRL